jgi:hypothetical protein
MRWIAVWLVVSGCGSVHDARCTPTMWYADEDGDGFGTPNRAVEACTPPPGFVASNTDCDDSNPKINPDTLWHIDFDGDGYGHMSVTQGPTCAQPGGYVLDGRDCNDLDPAIYPSRPACPIRTGLASCREILAAHKAEGDGAYEVDLDGAGPGAPQTVWCDMTTDGGGWMALINPAVMPATMGAGATFAGATVSGTSSCEGPPVELVQNGWRGLALYRCGDGSPRLTVTWPNPVGATDVMFIATTQGQSQVLRVNGTQISASGSTTDGVGALCGFWNGDGATVHPGTNACASTYLDAPALRRPGAISGAFTLDITSGPSCAPNCNYGAGMNLQKLFVR